MSHEFSKTRPLGGLNADDEVRELSPLDYLYGLNIRNAITELNKRGTLTNVKGNVKVNKITCPYNNTTALPSGINRCIGAVEDTKFNTVVFFVWNNTGAHGIYRYYRNVTDPSNPYGEIQQIVQYEFNWTKRTRITSASIVYGDPENDDTDVGDLLYWCDPVPHKINLTKGNIVGKRKSWYLQVPKTVTTFPALSVVRFLDWNGNLVYTQGYNLVDTSSQSAIITGIAELVNANPDSPVTAVACECKLQYIEKLAGTVWTIEFDTPQILNYADNWYGANLIERYFDRCKWQPMQAPQAVYEQDANYEPNYVQKKVFQFRSAYIYDDREQSALGVWSQIPINNLGCDGTNSPQYNYISVDFNDPELVNPDTLVLLKKVKLVARELNTGTDKSIIDLTPCDYLDYVGGEWIAQYSFYNDIAPSTIDTAEAAKLFNDVPLESGAEVFKENRIIEGNCLTGYNPPDCIDATIQMDFAETPNPKLYSVKFKVRILTYGLSDAEQASGVDNGFAGLFPNLKKYPFWQAGNPNPDTGYTLVRGGIFHDTLRTENDFAFFGGGGFGAGAGGDFGIRSGMEDYWDQRLPEGGFVVYMAGTPYFGITKQISIGLPVDENGALDTSTAERRLAIGNYLYGGGDLYSEVELLLPAGKYVARMASHWCSFGDKLALGFPYNLSASTSFQKTSTNVWGIYTDGLNVWNKQKEFTFEVTNSDIDEACTFLVADLAPPYDVPNDGVWRSYNCYLYDDSNGVTANSNPNSSTFEGIPVEKAIVRYQPLTTPTSFTWQNVALTDHNGYWFAIGNQGNQFVAGQINGITACSTTVMYTGSLGQLYEKTLSPLPMGPTDANPDIGLRYGVIATDNALTRTSASTIISGNVENSLGVDIAGVTVIYQNGQYTNTNIDGSYTILAWGDMITPNLPNFPTSPANPITNGTNRVVDNLIFTLKVFCQPTYPNGQELTPVTIDPININGTDTPPPYSPTAWYDAGVFIIEEGNDPNRKARKRGGNYIDAIRCYDSAGRCCTVVFAAETYVPFITEDIGKYGIQDFSGNIYPAGTYISGKPSLKWVLAPTTVFPAWVKTFQWMRTKNGIYGRYLQWVINQVTYISQLANPIAGTPEIISAFQNADAVAIKLSVKNIVDYASQTGNSQIGYIYQAGDRIRLIADRELVNYTNVNDFEILGQFTTGTDIYIKPEGFPQEIFSGTLLEIFNAKTISTQDQQIFYETGEVVNVNNGIPESYSGVFTEGDTYWRGRTIIVNDPDTKFAAAYPVVIEDASVSDFYPSEAQDIGRIGVIDDNFRQVRRPMLLKASNQFIPSTAINGLSSFEALNEKELDRNSGSIQNLISVNQTIVAVSSLREISNYIQVVTLQQAAEGQGVLAVADQFFGTQYPHSKTLGTDLPATVVTNDSMIWGWVNQRANVWKYRGDGERTISDEKMINYFNQLKNDGVTDAVATYYRYTKEYIITLWRKYQIGSVVTSFTKLPASAYIVRFAYSDGDILPQIGDDAEYQYLYNGTWQTAEASVSAIENGLISIITTLQRAPTVNQQVNLVFSKPETIAWYDAPDSIDPNTGATIAQARWVTFYSFTPECYSMIGSELVSFKNAEVWIHDKNDLRNNFYGVQYATEITPVFNAQPEFLKVWNSCVLQTKQDNNDNNWSMPVIINDNNQLSRINNAGFVKKGETWYAPFKRDLNDLTVPSNIRISQGRSLRSSTLTCEMINDYTGQVTLYLWSANFTLSERTSK